MNIVIVGHIDHGKSTLIGRLLFDTDSVPESVVAEAERSSSALGKKLEFAYLVDSLEEERQQNITIDTTQTFFKTEKRRYAIIDAPGHKEFLRNMVSGASRAEAAILVVDISRGMEEQSRRHAYVLKLLGIQKVLVAVNKMDSVEYSQDAFEKMRGEILSFFEKLELTPCGITPISAMNGDNVAKASANLAWYNSTTLLEELDKLAVTEGSGFAATRYVVQVPFPHNGKEHFLGRVENGSISVGDEVSLFPGGKKVKIAEISHWPESKQSAETGESVSVVLDDSSKVGRGAILCNEPLPVLTKELRATVFSLTQRSLSKEERFTIKCATQSIPCKIEKILSKVNSSTLESLGSDCTDLDEAEVADVLIRAEAPIAVESFSRVAALGRFVLSDADGICAAGIVPECQ